MDVDLAEIRSDDESVIEVAHTSIYTSIEQACVLVSIQSYIREVPG
jgi:hypothetical protein